MSSFKYIKDSTVLARRLISARVFLEKSSEFLTHVSKSVAEKDKILPLNPQGMHRLYTEEHESLMDSIVRPYLKQQNDSDSVINVIGVKTYMEGYASHPPMDLIDFYSFLMANRVVVSSNKEWIGPRSNFRGIVRAPPHMPLVCPTLASDASVHARHNIAGGGFLFWSDGSNPLSYEFRCGSMMFPKSVSPSYHPRSNKLLLRLELEALRRGLQFLADNCFGLTHLRVLVDSLDLTEIINGDVCIPDDESYGDYITVKCLLRRYFSSVQHIVRERNLAADRLAFFGKSDSSLTEDWEENHVKNVLGSGMIQQIHDILEMNLYNKMVNRFPDGICI